MERAACGRIDWAWDVPFKDNTFALRLNYWVWYRNGREEGLCIGVEWCLVKFLARGYFDDPPKIHDGDAITNVFHD